MSNRAELMRRDTGNTAAGFMRSSDDGSGVCGIDTATTKKLFVHDIAVGGFAQKQHREARVGARTAPVRVQR